MDEDDFIKETLIEMGFDVTEYYESEFGGWYGKSVHGMNNVNWNWTDRCISVMKDANTRTGFNGQVFTVEHFKLIMELVR